MLFVISLILILVMNMEKRKFRSQWFNDLGVNGLDYSNQFEEVFEEIPPFTKDDKGVWLNDSSVPKLVSKGKVNVQEKIQSFAEDVDIYKILEKFAMTGDTSYIMQRTPQAYDVDISDIPTNYNDYQDYLKNNLDRLNDISPETRTKLLKGETLTSEDLDREVKLLAQKNGISFDSPVEEIKEEKKDGE